jgi:adenine C2-methylase RlmN of 23S rRNA A2503 and tRNA A37
MPSSRRKTVPCVLDRQALLQALEDRGSPLKLIHLEAFYHCMHKWGHPEPADFVKLYRDAFYPPGADADALKKLTRNKPQFPKSFLDFLQTTSFVTMTTAIKAVNTSADKSTTKLAIALHDGLVVESVIMRYQPSEQGAGGHRVSLCVSSQSGCAMGCTFCATGTMGWSGNLTTGEILEQVIHAERVLRNDSSAIDKYDKVRNIVFMGMGEPLDNYNAVTDACRALMDRKRWNLSQGRVTISTVGLVSQIRKLTRELPQVGLALSLHAPTQAMREAIVPTASRYPVADLILALDEHNRAASETRSEIRRRMNIAQAPVPNTRHRAMIEYVMIKGPTTTLEAAHELGRLCQGRQIVVNLIPYNPTNVQDPLECPSWEQMREFRSIVGSYGIFCTIRRTMGADIDSACGQLVRSIQEEKKEDIEDGFGARPVVKKAAKKIVKKKQGSKVAPVVQTASVGANKQADEWDVWIRPLQIATVVAATCFVASSVMFLRQQKKR